VVLAFDDNYICSTNKCGKKIRILACRDKNRALQVLYIHIRTYYGTTLTVLPAAEQCTAYTYKFNSNNFLPTHLPRLRIIDHYVDRATYQLLRNEITIDFMDRIRGAIVSYDRYLRDRFRTQLYLIYNFNMCACFKI